MFVKLCGETYFIGADIEIVQIKTEKVKPRTPRIYMQDLIELGVVLPDIVAIR